MRESNKKKQARARRRKVARQKQIIWQSIIILIFIAITVYYIATAIFMHISLNKKEPVVCYGSQAIEDTTSIKEEETTVIPAEETTSSNIKYTVGKPQELTYGEALEVLQEYAKKDKNMKKITNHASKYPEQLIKSLANNPELRDYAVGYLKATDTAETYSANANSKLTDSEKAQQYPLFLQWDKRWGYNKYGDGEMGLYGCGPTALSMATYYLTGNEDITPDVIASWSMENGFYVYGVGTAWNLMMEGANHFGVNSSYLSVDEYAMKNHLDNGGVIICTMNVGDFTTSGHFIVIYGYDESGFCVNDPNCIQRSNKRWSFDELQWQIKMIWGLQKY